MVAFSLGSLHIYRYGIFYIVGFAGAYLFFWYLAQQKFLKKYPRLQYVLNHKLIDIFLLCALGVLVGGRLGHIFIYDFTYYLYNPLKIFAIQQGGMSFIGGILGVALSLLIFLRVQKLSWKEIFLFFDFLVAIAPFGIMFGRIGNFLNQELYGVIVSDLLPRLGYPLFSILHDIGVFHVYPKIDQFLRVNTNFLAAFFEGLLLLAVMMKFVWKRIKTMVMKPGFLVGFFLVWYSAVRFVLEYFRQDSQYEFIGLFSKSQWFFVLFFLIGVVFLIRGNKKTS